MKRKNILWFIEIFLVLSLIIAITIFLLWKDTRYSNNIKPISEAQVSQACYLIITNYTRPNVENVAQIRTMQETTGFKEIDERYWVTCI